MLFRKTNTILKKCGLIKEMKHIIKKMKTNVFALGIISNNQIDVSKQKNNKVICYYQKIGGDKFSLESEQLIELWRKSWRNNGWEPIVLDEGYAKRHPDYHLVYLNNINSPFYSNINKEMWKYHRCCYMRLLAYCNYVIKNGTTLCADYDVINYSFSYEKFKDIPDNSYLAAERCVVKMNKDGAKDIINALLKFQQHPDNNSSADVYVMERYTSVFSLFGFVKGKGSKYIKYVHSGDAYKKSPLVHYHGGCYKRQNVDRSISRLDLINKLRPIK